MGYIFTIETDNKLFVSACKRASKRFIPKCGKLLLDDVINDDLLYFKKYWICQLKSWGIELANKNSNGITNTEKKMLELKAKRKSHRWTESDFNIGKQFKVKDRNGFRTLFLTYAKAFEKNVTLSFEKINNKLIATVIFKPEKSPAIKHVSKNGLINYYRPVTERKVRVKKEPIPKKWKVQRYNLRSVKIGDIISIKAERLVSFMNTVSKFNRDNKAEVFYNYSNVGESIRIEITDKFNCMKGTRISDKQKNEILNEPGTLKSISKKYNRSISSVWKIKTNSNKS